MRVGFIGLGAMGQAMAIRLQQAGHELVVFNRSAAKADPVVAIGATRAQTMAAAASQPVVITMVADDAALASILDGGEVGNGSGSEGGACGDGLLAALPPGGIHISMSTISVALAERMQTAHEAAGQTLICAPVMGRPDAAAGGKLRILAAGFTEAMAKVQPLFDAMGQQTFVVGDEPYMAAVMKLANNFMLVSMVEAFAEATGLVRQNGVDPQRFFDVVTTVWGSPMLQNYGRMMVERQFTPGFKLGLALKDMRLALAAADRAGVPLPLADLAKQHLLLGAATGLAEQDLSALIRAVETASGINP